MPLMNKGKVGTPFQDKYTTQFNKFLSQGQPKLNAFVNEYGAISYGFEGIDGTDDSNLTPTDYLSAGARAGISQEEEAGITNQNPFEVDPVNTPSDPYATSRFNPTVSYNDPNNFGPGGNGGEGVGTAGAGEAGGAGAAGTAGDAGDGDGSSGSGSGEAARGGVINTKKGGKEMASGMHNHSPGSKCYACGGPVSTKYAEGGPVESPMAAPEGLMEPPMPMDSPQEEMGEQGDLKQLVGDLIAGKLDKDSFVNAVVEMVQAEEPEAMPMPAEGGGEGLMAPPPMGMAEGGSVKTRQSGSADRMERQPNETKEQYYFRVQKDAWNHEEGVPNTPENQEYIRGMKQDRAKNKSYAEGGIVDPPQPMVPPEGQVQGTVADPAIDKSDTVDVQTDQGGNAKLTSGEFVIPSDAARFIGHEKLMKMVEKARQTMSGSVPQVKEQAAAPANQGGGGLMNKPMTPPVNPSTPKPMAGNTGLLSAPPGLADRTAMIN